MPKRLSGSALPEDLRVYWPERRIMSNEAEKGRLAEEVGERWISFQQALSDKRKYSRSKFNAFAKSTRKYIRVLGNDSLIHRDVANAIHSLVDFLTVERRQVPGASFRRQTDSRVLCSAGMIHILTATNRQTCKWESPDC